jgi:hypothetical protein
VCPWISSICIFRGLQIGSGLIRITASVAEIYHLVCLPHKVTSEEGDMCALAAYTKTDTHFRHQLAMPCIKPYMEFLPSQDFKF